MLNRQKIVLLMLRESGGKASHLQLTKWLFMLSQESPLDGGSALYQFVPYKHGPFSFTLFQEVRALLRDGYITSPDEHTWQLTNEGRDYKVQLPKNVSQYTREIMYLYSKLSSEALLDIVYKRHPWYTLNAADESRRAATLPEAPQAIYTVGYEGLLVDGFMNILLQSGIQQVLDVRNNPSSRRYGFHKSTLSRICESLGIKYIHLPQVGIPTESRSNLTSESDYQALFRMYERDILSSETQTIKEIRRILVELPGALVCMEADPSACHRSRLAKAVALDTNLPVTHLGWPR